MRTIFIIGVAWSLLSSVAVILLTLRNTKVWKERQRINELIYSISLQELGECETAQDFAKFKQRSVIRRSEQRRVEYSTMLWRFWEPINSFFNERVIVTGQR